MKKIGLYILVCVLTLCCLTACGAANTRYVENNSGSAGKIEVKPVSYAVFWTESFAKISSSVNNMLPQIVKIKDKVEIINEHEKTVPEIIDKVQKLIDDSSLLELSAEDKAKNDARVEELKNLKVELENYELLLKDPNVTTDDMQTAIDTIVAKVKIVNNVA